MRTTTAPHLAVGSSILGLVTAGMYDNPLTIYREYIQNAVDALAQSPANAEGKIAVTLDPQERTVRIRDDGPGLTYKQSQKELLPIGRSSKCIGIDRGFRGIGRLSGLAFAPTVTFRTRRHYTDPVTRVVWTSAGPKSQHEWPERAEDALQHCVTVDTEPGEKYPEHFFEAEVSGISRHAAGTLLNEDAVRSYIGEVCPVPMSSTFPYAKKVADLFNSDHPLTSQVVTVNDSPQPVQRQHSASIRFNDHRNDCFTDLEPFRIPRLEGAGDAAIAWVAHSSYTGAIPKAAAVRGIRARLGNIQIGDESVFDHLFQEDRFNRWCVGEVHILDPHIIPNGRRDYFEPGPHLRNLENHLGPIFRGLVARCRTASSVRNKNKKGLAELGMLEEAYELAVAGYLSGDDATELVQRTLAREASVREKVLSAGMSPLYSERLDRIIEKLTEFAVPPPSEWYEGMPGSEVTVYQSVFRALATTARSARPAKETIETILAHGKKLVHT